MEGNLLKVQPIRNGTVIDHINANMALKIIQILRLSDSGSTVSVLINVPSKKLNKKDMIKIEDRELSKEDSAKLALLSPGAHVNIIRNYTVAEKLPVKIPNTINNVASCPSTNCISNNERGSTSRLELKSEVPLILSCYYCNRRVDEGNLVLN